jgi:hypothetical protein
VRHVSPLANIARGVDLSTFGSAILAGVIYAGATLVSPARQS